MANRIRFAWRMDNVGDFDGQGGPFKAMAYAIGCGRWQASVSFGEENEFSVHDGALAAKRAAPGLARKLAAELCQSFRREIAELEGYCDG